MCEYGIMVGMDSMRTYTLGEFSRLTGKATSTLRASFSYLICVHQCFFMCEYGIMVGMDSMRTYTLGEFSRLTGKATSTLHL